MTPETPGAPEKLTELGRLPLEHPVAFERSVPNAARKALARLDWLETQHEALMKWAEDYRDLLAEDGHDRTSGDCDKCVRWREIDALISLSPLPAQAAKDGE